MGRRAIHFFLFTSVLLSPSLSTSFWAGPLFRQFRQFSGWKFPFVLFPSKSQRFHMFSHLPFSLTEVSLLDVKVLWVVNENMMSTFSFALYLFSVRTLKVRLNVWEKTSTQNCLNFPFTFVSVCCWFIINTTTRQSRLAHSYFQPRRT